MTKSKSKLEYFPVKVLMKRTVSVVREADPDDEWDQDDTCCATTFNGVKQLSKDAEDSDLAVPFSLEAGNAYFLVTVSYSTGDSFHRDEGCVDLVNLFRSRNKAETLKAAIEEHVRLYTAGHPPKGFKPFMFKYADEAGVEVTLCPPWIGFFEGDQVVNVVTLEAK